MNTNFDIFAQIGKEIETFNNDYLNIAGGNDDEGARYLKKAQKGYKFNQAKMLDLIDLYYNSKFETGQIDTEGQRKLFLNVCAFRADVASKMIDLDTKDFVFIPDDADSKWGAYFISKEFKDWAKQNYFGEFINDCVERLPKYGTIVGKKVGKKVEILPLRYLINQQDAKDLKTAKFVIQIHNNMTIDDMKAYPDWNTKNVDMEFGETTTVYERYGRVPASEFYKLAERPMPQEDEGKNIECVVITTCAKVKDKWDGKVLFIEKVKDRPFLECHWKRQDGRWLGIGEVENQLENQIARNMIANLRRRALLWSSKKIFQSPDVNVAKNLIRDVKDGDVLEIATNGNITQVDMASRQIGEFTSAEQVWESNSDQKSFTYEVATGESLPSGTPFRLGVVMSNAVNSHFGFKREKLGFFLKKIVEDFVFDIFKQENSKEHTLTIFGTESGLNDLKKVYAETAYSNKILDWAMGDNLEIPNFEVWKQEIEADYQNKSHLFVTIPDKFYDNIKHHITLSITGEEINVDAQITSLTTIYQSLVQQGDPRAEQLLSKIMSLTGQNLEAMLGEKPEPQQPIQVANQAIPSTIPQVPQLNPQATL